LVGRQPHWVGGQSVYGARGGATTPDEYFGGGQATPEVNRWAADNPNRWSATHGFSFFVFCFLFL
jgi:hypothetical protein